MINPQGGVGLCEPSSGWNVVWVSLVTVFYSTPPLPPAPPSVGVGEADAPFRTVLLTFGSGQVALRHSLGT